MKKFLITILFVIAVVPLALTMVSWTTLNKTVTAGRARTTTEIRTVRNLSPPASAGVFEPRSGCARRAPAAEEPAPALIPEGVAPAPASAPTASPDPGGRGLTKERKDYDGTTDEKEWEQTELEDADYVLGSALVLYYNDHQQETEAGEMDLTLSDWRKFFVERGAFLFERGILLQRGVLVFLGRAVVFIQRGVFVLGFVFHRVLFLGKQRPVLLGEQ